MKARAAVLREASSPYSIEEIDLPELGPGDILVRMVAAGMCHTDMVPRSGMAGALPIVTGHEGAGVVEAVGSSVSGVAVGDHVLLSFDSCGLCDRCQSGHPAYCVEWMTRNLSGLRPTGDSDARDGDGQPVGTHWFGQSSFATYTVTTLRNTVVVDPSLPLEVLSPLGCGMMTGAGAVLNVLKVGPGQSLLVTGAGAVGLAAVMAAKAVGAKTIVAVDVQQSRLDLALELGATHAVNGTSPDVVEQIRATTGGMGIEHALDTTGAPPVVIRAIESLALHGTVCLVGVSGQDVVVPFDASLLMPTVTWILMGDAVPRTVIPQLITLWQQGRFPVEKLISRFPFEKINEAEAASASGEVVKPVLTFG